MKVFIKFCLTNPFNYYTMVMNKNLEQLIEELKKADLCDVKEFDLFDKVYGIVYCYENFFDGKIDEKFLNSIVNINDKVKQIISGKVVLPNIEYNDLKNLSKSDLKSFKESLKEQLRLDIFSVYEVLATNHLMEEFYGEPFLEEDECPHGFRLLRKWFFENSNLYDLDDYRIFGMRAIKKGDKIIYYLLHPGEEQFGIVYKKDDEERFNKFIRGTRRYKLGKLLK